MRGTRTVWNPPPLSLAFVVVRRAVRRALAGGPDAAPGPLERLAAPLGIPLRLLGIDPVATGPSPHAVGPLDRGWCLHLRTAAGLPVCLRFDDALATSLVAPVFGTEGWALPADGGGEPVAGTLAALALRALETLADAGRPLELVDLHRIATPEDDAGRVRVSLRLLAGGKIGRAEVAVRPSDAPPPPPPGAVEACLDRVLDAPGLPAPLRRAAHALRATLALEDGDEASARAEAERAGVVADWEVAGPFRDPRRNPLAGGGTVAEAVAALRDDPAATLAGRRGAVAFRAPPAPRPDGVLDLERAVPLGDGACALLRLALPAGGATELLLGGAPAFTVWLEGSRAAAEPISIPAARGDAAPDRLAVAVPASRAPRVVLVGVCPEGGPAVVRAFLGRGGSDVERAARILADPPSRDPDALLAAAELLVEAGALPRDADPLAGPLSALPAERAAPAALLLARSSVTAADRHAAAARAAPPGSPPCPSNWWPSAAAVVRRAQSRWAARWRPIAARPRSPY